MKKHLWAVCYGLALTAFTAYLSLDTFVLRSAYQTNIAPADTSVFASLRDNTETSQGSTEEQAADSDASPGTSAGSKTHGRQHERSSENAKQHSAPADSSAGQTDAAVSDSSVSGSTYQDENSSITMSEYYLNNTRIYVADVQLSSAEYLKTAFANDTYGKNVTAKTSSIAAANHAVLAVNGDFYGARERGYVIRNGVVYRDTASDDDLLCIFADGSMQVMSQSDHTANELVSMGVWQAFSFGPGLVENGTVTVSQNDEVGKAMASNPRTAIGMISENHYLFVVSDGRTDESEGLSLYQLAQFMQSLGSKTAYNLDGGGSSAMYYNGQIVNKPTTNGSIRERGVSDIVYIG